MSNKFYLKSKNGILALAIKVKDSPRKQSPIYGEVDVIIECSKSDKIYGLISIGLEKYYFSHVSHVSWHGFYAFKENRIHNPVVRFHSKKSIDEYRHRGTVNKSDQFAFPIATFFIDTNNVGGFSNNVDRNFQELQFNRSAVDLFVLPKGMSFQRFTKTSVSIFFFIAHMSVYNQADDYEFSPIEIGSMLYYHKVIGERVVLLRERKLPEEFIVPDGVFAMFHDPNMPLEALLNRYIAYDRDDKAVLLKDRYIKELRKL